MLRGFRFFRKVGSSVENELTPFRRSSHERFEFYEEMPKSKEYLSSDDSDSSGDKAPKRKREKEEKKRSSKDSEEKADTSKKAKTSEKKDESTWEIGNSRFVRLNPFKGKLLIDIREMYMDSDTGNLKPGKKGISLTVPQWQKFMDSIGEIDKAVKSKS